MKRQVGLGGLIERLRTEVPQWSRLLPQFPRLAANALAAVENQERVLTELAELRRTSARRNQWLTAGVLLLAAIVLMFGWAFLGFRLPRL